MSVDQQNDQDRKDRKDQHDRRDQREQHDKPVDAPVDLAGPLARRLASLPGDERAIVEQIVGRLEGGVHTYGPWNVADGRNNPTEALLEVLDALAYCAAELVRLAREVRR